MKLEVTLTALKKTGGMSGSGGTQDVRFAVNEGGDGRLYITNSYGLGLVEEGTPLGLLFREYNLTPEPGYYRAGVGIVKEGSEYTPPQLKQLVEGAKKNNPIERTELVGRPVFIRYWGKERGDLAVFGDGPHVLARQDLIDVYIVQQAALWTSDGARKPLNAWDKDGALLGLVMPVAAP